ncbi:MAG: FAD-binding oxidoreductase, partial [Thermoplasmata archaeon]
IALKYGIPITPAGGLTGMLGSAVPLHGGIMLDTTAMAGLIEIDVPNQVIRVKAGTTIKAINDMLEPHNLWLPNQPESKYACTIGAEIACDNDSTFGMKYGKILNALLSVRLVAGNGKSYELGHRKARFSSSGYKLMHLLAGSEGTLGIITEVSLKAEPSPPARSVDMVIFDSLGKAVLFLNELLRCGILPEGAHINCRKRLEFYTHAYRQKYGFPPKIPEWARAALFIIFSGSDTVLKFHRETAFDILKNYQGHIVEEREIVDSWWKSKHTLEFEPFAQKWPASQRVKKFGAADPGIPMGRLEEYYDFFLKCAAKHGLDVLGMNAYLEHPNSVGFSLSCAVFVDYRNQKEVEAFREYHREMALKAVELEGTMSTYMSDSDVKVPLFEKEHGEAASLMLELKKMFDPYGIMNPGKKFSFRHTSGRRDF